ncbi:hypothetical protein ACEQ8H_005522 [Pleosporales sp. CAS-2024a]
MAFLLYRFIRRKFREHKTQDAIPNTKDTVLVKSYLTPQATPTQQQSRQHVGHELEHGATAPAQSAEAHINAFIDEEWARQKEEARKRRIRQWKLMIGLALSNFLASVDVTFVGLSIIASIALGNVWVGKPTREAKDDKPARAEEKGKVLYGWFLPAMLIGNVWRKSNILT